MWLAFFSSTFLFAVVSQCSSYTHVLSTQYIMWVGAVDDVEWNTETSVPRTLDVTTFIDYLPNCTLIMVFVGPGRESLLT